MIRFAAAAVLLLTFSTVVFADLIIEAREVGNDVVFTTSGSLDLTGWTSLGVISDDVPHIWAERAGISFAPLVGASAEYFDFDSVIPPNSFGNGGQVNASTSSGNFAFYNVFSDFGGPSSTTTIGVEPGYAFGEPIEANMTFENATIDSLGINPGDTVWSWELMPVSNGVKPVSIATSSITLRAIAIPEPSAFAFLGLIGLVACGRSWWKRRR